MTAPSAKARPPIIAMRDLILAAMLPGFAVMAWTIPERYWERIAKGLVDLRERIGMGEAAQGLHIQAITRGTPLASAATQIARSRLANDYVERLQLLGVHSPSGWNAKIQLEGQRHIDHALAEGRGAILWVANLSYYRQVTKMALHRAGYCVCHLSSIVHGFSETRFGMRVLNPIRTSAEVRFLDERLVLETSGKLTAMRALMRRLRRNGLISITASAAAPNAQALPFFGGLIHLSVGPAKLSAQTKAPILPVFALRQSDGSFVVEVRSPLAAPVHLRTGTATSAALERYKSLLESRVRRYPDQFRWHEVTCTSKCDRDASMSVTGQQRT